MKGRNTNKKFKVITKDKDNVFCWNILLDWVDVDTFEFLGGDKYKYWVPCFAGADEQLNKKL